MANWPPGPAGPNTVVLVASVLLLLDATDGHLKFELGVNLGVTFDSSAHYYLLSDERYGRDWIRLNDEEQLEDSVNKTLSTTILIHGWGSNIKDSFFNNMAWGLRQATEPTNVIAVDWSELDSPLYLVARNRVRTVANLITSLVHELVKRRLARPSNIHLIGHCLGAHIAGVTGRSITVRRITGLDPASGLFFFDSADRLSRESADVVDVVHTSIGVSGYAGPLGHVDFYPNGGRTYQPGCDIKRWTLRDVEGRCSQNRAYELYAVSIVYPKIFPSIHCSSYRNANEEDCYSTTVANMGYHIECSEPGLYSLRTTHEFPFGLGPRGRRGKHPLRGGALGCSTAAKGTGGHRSDRLAPLFTGHRGRICGPPPPPPPHAERSLAGPTTEESIQSKEDQETSPHPEI